MGKANTTAFQIIRKQALERDEKRCVKCGSDEVDNLDTLCERCHREWELIAYGAVEYQAWRRMPPASVILAALAMEDAWGNDMTAREARHVLLHMIGEATRVLR